MLDHDDRARARQMWELGDYPAVAALLVPGAQQVCAAAGTGAGRPALDVATGSGSLALALAGEGWQVSAVDIAPRLMEVGRCRAQDLGQDIRWREASMDDLPFPAAGFDLVASSFGLIFAPDPREVLAEVRRVLRPGGVLAYSAWTPDGFMGRMSARIGDLLSLGDRMLAPFRWGDPGVTVDWLAGDFSAVTTHGHTLPWTFRSARDATDFLFEHSPSHLVALELAGPRGGELVETVTEWTGSQAKPDGSIDIRVDYIVTTARRR